MGTERLKYKNNFIDADNHVISWLQKYMELSLLEHEHPSWFSEVLADLHGNFHVPHGKFFFDESILESNPEHLEYCIKMLDITIAKMQQLTKRNFFDFIRNSIKESWCDINADFYNDEWISDDINYNTMYVGTLKQLKKIMTQ